MANHGAGVWLVVARPQSGDGFVARPRIGDGLVARPRSGGGLVARPQVAVASLLIPEQTWEVRFRA